MISLTSPWRLEVSFIPAKMVAIADRDSRSASISAFTLRVDRLQLGFTLETVQRTKNDGRVIRCYQAPMPLRRTPPSWTPEFRYP